MLRRWHVLVMITVVLLATCLATAVKLRATPKYDRVKVGMKWPELLRVFGAFGDSESSLGITHARWRCDEGLIWVRYESHGDPKQGVTEKGIVPHSPLERLAWLAGWR